MAEEKTAEKSEFDDHAAKYAEEVNNSISFSGMKVENFALGKAADIRRRLEGHRLDSSANVLDIGCGIGQYQRLLGDSFSIVGVDTSLESIRVAEKLSPVGKFFYYDGSRLPFDDQTFDCAFTICVAHHVPLTQRSNFLAEAKRVLKPGGLLLVYEHNPKNVLTRWAVERCVFDKDAILLSPNYAEQWLTGLGFVNVSTSFLFSLPPLNSWLISIDRILHRVPSGAQFVTVGKRPHDV